MVITKEILMAKYESFTVKITNSRALYERDYKPAALRYAREAKRNGNPAQTAEADVLERELIKAAEKAINAAEKEHGETIRDIVSAQVALQIDPEQAETKLKQFERKLHRNHNHHLSQHQELLENLIAVKDDIDTYRQDSNINREPILSRLHEVWKQALPFGVFESFVGTSAVKAAGAPLFEAILVGISSTVNNIGLGAFLLAQVIPFVHKKNGKSLWWLGLIGSIIIASFVLSVNLNLMELRGHNANDDSSLIGLLFFAFNMFVWAFWFHKFITAKDIFIEYGRLGDAREDAKEDLREPAIECRDAILVESQALDNEFEELIQQAAVVITQSTQHAQQCAAEAEQFDLAQRSIIAVFEDVTEYMRHDVGGVLGDMTPTYFDQKPDYSHLIRKLAENDVATKQLDHHHTLSETLNQNIQAQHPNHHDLVASYQDQIEAKFGGAHV